MDPYGGNIRGAFIIDGTRSGRGLGNRGHGCLRFSFCIVPAIIVYTSRAHGAKLNTLAMPRTHTARGCLPLYTVRHTHTGGTQAWWRALPSLGGFYASGTTSNDGRAGVGEQLRTSALSNLRAYLGNEFHGGFRKLDFNP